MEEKGYPAYLLQELHKQQLEKYSGRVLLGVVAKKIIRAIGSFLGQNYVMPSVACYNGLVVFGTYVLDGGGTDFGQDYIRCLLELGVKRCERIYEFCAGPGYIGYSLLANGFCERLTLSDINPAAVRIAKKTASYNRIENIVNIYLSNCLEDIPKSEQWDLVVGNPPHFLRFDNSSISSEARKGKKSIKLPSKDIFIKAINLKSIDPGWSIHKLFYAAVKKFMKPDGLVVMQENAKGSDASIFKPMIEAGGGKFIAALSSKNICGKDNGMYYVVSKW